MAKPGPQPLLEAWQPTSSKLRQAFVSLHEVCQNATLSSMSLLMGDEKGVLDNASIQGADAVIFSDVSPHVDDYFDRWFVLWTVKAAGQTLHSKRAKPGPPASIHDPKPAAPTPGQSVQVEEGQMIILDAHHLHWTTTDPPLGTHMDRSRRFSVMLAAQSVHRPTREEAERLMEAQLEAGLSTYPPAKFEQSTPPTRRHRP